MVRVAEGRAAVVERRGRPRVLSAGRHLLVPGLDRVLRHVDLRAQHLDVPPFVSYDRNGAEVVLGLRLGWTVKDPVAATYEILDVAMGLEQLATTATRHHVGALTADEVLVGSGALTEQVRALLAEAGTRWGVAIDRVDVTLER